MNFWTYTIVSFSVLVLFLALYFFLRRRITEQNRQLKNSPKQDKITLQKKKFTTKRPTVPPSLDVILKNLEKALGGLTSNGDKEANLFHTVRSLRESVGSPLLVTVLGEFSSGKSTFINALLSEKLLPMKQKETTATITRLQYGMNRRMIVQYKDGKVENYDLSSNGKSNLETFLVENFKESDNILDMLRQVTIELNNDILLEIDIADTPGFNSKYNRHTEITTEFIKYSDLIIWLFSAKQLGKASELKNLQEHCKIFKPIGVINQIDRLNLREGETVQNNLANALSKFDGLFERLFFVSALKGLEPSTYVDSGIPEFLSYLKEVIIPEAKMRKEKSILNKLIHIGVELSQSLSLIVKNITDVKEKIKKIKALIAKLQDWNTKWTLISTKWENDSKDLNKLLSNVEKYFLITAPPSSIVIKASELQKTLQEIEAEFLALNRESRSLDNLLQKLNVYYSDWQNRYQVYSQKGFGFKEFGDNIWESLFGEPVSEEKRILNQMAAEYEREREWYNQNVDKYNLQLQKTKNRVSRFDESVTHFLDNVLVNAINKQLEEIQKVSKEVESKEQEYQSLIKQLTILEKKAKIYHQQIFPVYQEAARFIGATEDLLNKQLANFPELIKYLATQIGTSEVLDWSRIYNRTTIDKAIELRSTEFAEVQFAAAKERKKEKRQTKQV